MVGGVVLAGGRSTRMGTPKALLDWDGRPLVEHVADAVARAVNGPVVVVGAPGQELPPSLIVVRDPVEGRGPLQGLAAGLAALDADAAFVCGTDQPDAWRAAAALLDAWRPDDDVLLLAPGQPLGALYATRIAAVARQRVEGDDQSLRGLLAAVTTRVIGGDAAVLRSLDTPEAYREARS